MVLEILRRTGAQVKGMGHLMANIYCTFPTLQTRLKIAVACLKVSLGEFICLIYESIWVHLGGSYLLVTNKTSFLGWQYFIQCPNIISSQYIVIV